MIDYHHKVLSANYEIVTPTLEDGEYIHALTVIPQDQGETVNIVTSIAFEGVEVTGNTIVFILGDYGAVNPNRVFAELIHQAFARQSGFIQVKMDILIPAVPTVYQIYGDLL